MRTWRIAAVAGLCALAASRPPSAVHAQTGAAPAAATTTSDIRFKSHDGYDMRGRLTLPNTPGRHAVLVMVQTAEASMLDGRTRNAKGERVSFYDLYRDNLAPLDIGFFSYEGRGVTTNESGAREINDAIYNTSTLENKVQDAISAVRLLEQQPGVDRSRIFLRGISEGSLLAAETAARIPKEIKGVVLSGVIGSTLKSALVFMASDGMYLSHRGHWDADGDGRISAQEFESDPKGIRALMSPQAARFSMWDTDGDGFYTNAELRALMRPIVNVIETENFDAFQPWLQGNSVTPVPDLRSWLKDHFSHPSMWSFVSELTMPVGIFQGESDANTSAEQVRQLERRAKAAGKTNIEFSYFEGLDHGLGSLDYFLLGKNSAGYEAIFDFMKRHAEANK